MSSHPGSTINDAIELALFLKSEGLHPEQVQDFYPTPGTVSTCMFYTGLDPYTMQEVYVPRTKEEKAQQRALLQYFRPENRQIVLSALKKAGRYDLIGTGKDCLVADTTPTRSAVKHAQNGLPKRTLNATAKHKQNQPAKSGAFNGLAKKSQANSVSPQRVNGRATQKSSSPISRFKGQNNKKGK